MIVTTTVTPQTITFTLDFEEACTLIDILRDETIPDITEDLKKELTNRLTLSLGDFTEYTEGA